MKKRVARILAGLLVGMVMLAAVIWVLTKTLGNTQFPTLYAGRTFDYWQQQLYGHDTGASNAALAVLDSQLIPQFVDTMSHDTRDSRARVSLIRMLNNLPDVEILYESAEVRRAVAAESLGDFGPAAKAALPDLIRVLKGNDAAIRNSVISSLGRIRSEPETVIPLLIPYLEDDNFDVAAANALAEFGSLAKPAVPKLLPLLHAQDDDDRAAAQHALLRIDPEAAAKARNDLRRERADNSSTSRPNATGTTGAK
jgi:hypothetical protein